jgi:hypothetical protein
MPEVGSIHRSLPAMKNRLLLAIASAAILVAVLLWAIGGRAARTETSRSERNDPETSAAAPELAPALAEERAPASPPGEAATPGLPEPSASERSTSVGVPFRGQVVDVRTGEPVDSALARAEGFGMAFEAPTDAQGRFASDARLSSSFSEIQFFNAHNTAHIRTAPREKLEWLGEEAGWLARIRIGPTYRLRILAPGAPASQSWKLRVVESTPGQPDRATAWLDVVAGDPPWARFDNPLPDAPEGTTARIDVQNGEETLRGSAPVATTIGIHPGIITVALDERFARVLGRVVDSTAKPLARAEVSAIPRLGGLDDDGRFPGCRTDGEGRYAIGGLAPGTYWIHARPRRGEESQTIEIALPLGDTTAPDLIAPAETSAGAIEGFLRARGGMDFPPAAVRLRAVDGRRYEHYDVVDTKSQAATEGEVRMIGPHGQAIAVELKGFFEFQQVPEGEYELTVFATDGSSWSPSPLRVRPPRVDLEIVREDVGNWWTAYFRVSDAETGEPVTDFRAQILMNNAWTWEEQKKSGQIQAPEQSAHGFGWAFPETAQFRWNIHADGYCLASGTQANFVGKGPKRVAEVRLWKGYGARLVLRDAQGRFDVLDDDWAGRVAAGEHAPVVGAQVFADGELLATSDEHGVAAFEAPRCPERIEILAPGWTVLGSHQFRNGRIVGEAREIVVWMAR